MESSVKWLCRRVQPSAFLEIQVELQIKRLAFGLGAEVTGVSLDQPLSREVVAQIRQAWNEHCVLVFPSQPLEHEQHIAFSKNFGEPELHPEKHLRDGK